MRPSYTSEKVFGSAKDILLPIDHTELYGEGKGGYKEQTKNKIIRVLIMDSEGRIKGNMVI